MLNETTFTEIDDYLTGQLTDVEKEAFEAKMEKDPALKEEVELQKEIIQAFKEKGFEKLLKEQLAESAVASKPEKKGRIISFRPQQWAYVAIAAGIALLVMLWVVIGSQPNQNELFASNFKPYEADAEGIIRSGDSLPPVDQQFMNLLYYYTEGEYANARSEGVKFLEIADNGHAKKDEVLLLMGTTYLAEEVPDPNMAINYLSQVSAKTGPQKEASNWYMGLAYLKKADIQNSKSFFQQIPNDSKWHSRATKLLEWIEAYED